MYTASTLPPSTVLVSFYLGHNYTIYIILIAVQPSLAPELTAYLSGDNPGCHSITAVRQRNKVTKR